MNDISKKMFVIVSRDKQTMTDIKGVNNKFSTVSATNQTGEYGNMSMDELINKLKALEKLNKMNEAKLAKLENDALS